MDVVGLVGLLVLGVVVLTPVADRTGLPQPVLLVLYGLVLGVIPGVPVPDVPGRHRFAHANRVTEQ